MPKTSPLDQIIPVAITIKPTVLKTIMDSASQKETTPSYELGRLSQNLLEQIAQGGVMLDPSTVARIEAATGEELEPERLAERIEKSVGRRGAILSGQVEIDPAYEPAIQNIATIRGETVMETVQEIINYGMDQGWAFEIQEPPRMLRLTEEQYQFVKKSLGLERVTGDDVCDWIGQKNGSKVSILDGDLN